MTTQKTSEGKPDRKINISGKSVKVAGTGKAKDAAKKVIDQYSDAIKNLENR